MVIVRRRRLERGGRGRIGGASVHASECEMALACEGDLQVAVARRRRPGAGEKDGACRRGLAAGDNCGGDTRRETAVGNGQRRKRAPSAMRAVLRAPHMRRVTL